MEQFLCIERCDPGVSQAYASVEVFRGRGANMKKSGLPLILTGTITVGAVRPNPSDFPVKIRVIFSRNEQYRAHDLLMPVANILTFVGTAIGTTDMAPPAAVINP
jgi:hypothetical protein